MVAVLEAAWAAIRVRRPEAPTAVLVLGAGLVVVRRGQRVFNEVLDSYLRRVQFAGDGWAERIYLRKYGHADVLVDPRCSFRIPILAHRGVRVEAVIAAFKAGTDIDGLVAEYGVPRDGLMSVLRFHTEAAARGRALDRSLMTAAAATLAVPVFLLAPVLLVLLGELGPRGRPGSPSSCCSPSRPSPRRCSPPTRRPRSTTTRCWSRRVLRIGGEPTTSGVTCSAGCCGAGGTRSRWPRSPSALGLAGGLVIGTISGYGGGRVDAVLMRAVDVWLAVTPAGCRTACGGCHRARRSLGSYSRSN